MADKQKTVEIIFGGVDRTGGAITSVGRNLDSLSGRVGDLTGPLANITDSIIKLDTALAAAAIGVTGYAIKIADDFDTAFGEIATLIGQPADNLRDFQAQILEYSERSTASLDQITSATYGAISAGVDYRNSLELIAAAEQLSLAGRADLGATTTALVSTLNAFGAEASQAGDYADDFFTIVQLGQTTIPELSSTIGRLAPIAAAAGLSFEEMGAAIATITAETGTNTAEAITGIRAAINSLLKPSKEASDLAAELGIEFNAAALESKGFSGVLTDVAEATDGNTELMAKLFGSVEALAPVLALTGNASEKFAQNLDAFKDNAGAAETASKELTETLAALGQTLQNNLNSALIGLGSNLTDETRSIVQSITSIFNSLGSEIRLEDGVFAPILNGLEGLAQSIDEKLSVIAANFPKALSGIDLNELLSAFGDLGDELGDLFTGLFGDVDLSTVEGLEDVLQKVVDAFTALVNVSAGIANGLEPLFIAIGEGIEQFQSLDEETKKTAGEILGLAKTINTVLPAVGGLAGGLESIGGGLTALAGAQGFKAVIGNLNTIKSIASSTVGKGGLLGLALTGGYALGSFINDYFEEELNALNQKLFEYFNADELQEIAQAFAPLTGEAKKLAEETNELRKISQRYQEMNQALGQTMGYTTEITEEQRQELNRYAQQLVDNANKTEQFTGAQREVTNALDELNQSVEASGGALGNVSKTTEQLAANNKSLQLGYDETTGKINSFSGTIVNSNKALDEAAKKTEEVVKQTEEYQLKLLELNSNERIKLIEAKVSLDIAEVEAGADRIEAIAKTISETFSNSGDVIADLFGGFDDASRSTQIELSKQIREERELRQQALDDQSKLTQAEVDYIKEKTRQLARGDALIKVDGAGLQPHLEAFMFEILREIQVRMSANGEEMLLRLN
ncbi:phage tail tape measure protein [Marinobacter sp.]|uniref:phage tail tape measure protein n=1 Tax=Marinobacter sp. TaxID=50741 RepID=UPI0035C71AEA